MGSQDEMEALKNEIEMRAEAFRTAHGRRYMDSDVQGTDPAWWALLVRYREMGQEAAAVLQAGVELREGGCKFFIRRRRRYCTSMAQVGNPDGLCSEHAEETARVTPSFPELPGGSEVATSKHKKNMGRTPKHMLNPFRCPGQTAAPAWSAVYSDLSKPLLLDVGCARGRWVRDLAAGTTVRLELDGQTFNFCGNELYAPLVEAANAANDAAADAAPAAEKNLHFVSANAMTSLRSLELPNLHTVCIQFPDPWIKKKKRRVVSPALVSTLADLLPPGGQVYLSSDYFALALEMRAAFLGHGAFRLTRLPTVSVIPGNPTAAAQLEEARRRASPAVDADAGEAAGSQSVVHAARQSMRALPSVVTWLDAGTRPEVRWLEDRPFVLGTERDQVCEVHWRPSWRALLVRL
ncbi:putative methyltransferase-domain-containing protein [Baffinella frigidus]|nr:putative methyltransferase-domain-containing protein [Cryptophyta sp. CCMP2293]